MPKNIIDQKLELLMEIEGFEDELEFGHHFFNEGTVPGICMNEDCDATYHYEPDQTEGWCDCCNTNSVKSGFILMGII